MRTLPLTRIVRDGLRYEVVQGEEWIADENKACLDVVTGPLNLVVDIGGHIGFTTVLAASRGAQVYTLEPNPYNYATLVRNIQANELFDRVRPLQLALMPRDGQMAWLRSFAWNVGQTGLVQAEGQSVVGMAMGISLSTLWDLLPAGHAIDYFKMDIEGWEHYVLPCASQALWDSVRFFHLEIHDIESPGQKRFHASWGKNADLRSLLADNHFVQVGDLPVWERQV
jgi:FkbM family methyltransferase